MEGMETIEEQEGEVTFDVNVYPREWVILEDYMWCTKPVKIKAKFQATVFLRKEITSQEVFGTVYSSNEYIGVTVSVCTDTGADGAEVCSSV